MYRTEKKEFQREPVSPLKEILINNEIESSAHLMKRLNFSPKRFILFISVIAIILILLSLSGQFYRFFFNEGKETFITKLFNLDCEWNIPTYFSSVLLFSCSVMFILISRTFKESNYSYIKNWVILGSTFLVMSIDEVLQFHEKLNATIRGTLHTHGFFYFGWLIPAGIFILLFLIYNIRFYISLKPKFQYLFFLSGFIYVLGVYVMEMVGGKFFSLYGENNFGYAILTTIEESLEIFGIIILLYTLFTYIKEELRGINIHISTN